MTTELKPCPAGHSVVTIITAPHKEPIMFLRRFWQLEHAYGYCADCGWKGPKRSTVEEAVDVWNDRAEKREWKP